MTERVCGKEPLVIHAALSDQWDAELRRHVSGCSDCAETAAATSVLKQLEQTDRSSAGLPGAAQLWWRMQLRARREAIERAARPVSLLQSITLVLAVMSFAGMCAWQWDALRTWLSAVPLHEFAVHFWQSWGLVLIGGVGAAAVFLVIMVLLAHPND